MLTCCLDQLLQLYFEDSLRRLDPRCLYKAINVLFIYFLKERIRKKMYIILRKRGRKNHKTNDNHRENVMLSYFKTKTQIKSFFLHSRTLLVANHSFIVL